jgi:hypothetical protein
MNRWAAITSHQLVEERLPVGWHFSPWSGSRLIGGVRMRGKQLCALAFRLRLVIVEPILARLKAGYDRMPGRRSMFGCVLARRTVAAPDVPALGAAAEMKPPATWRRKAFHAAVAAGFGCEINSTTIFFHCDLSSNLRRRFAPRGWLAGRF